jgi:hypothetical protein
MNLSGGKPLYEVNCGSSPGGSRSDTWEAFDWAFIDSIDTTDLLITKNKSVLASITRQFLDSRRFSVQSQIRSSRLLEMLQIVVRSLANRNHDLERKLKKAQAKEEKQPNQFESLCFFCPICQKAFRRISQVDSHVFAHHAESATLWQAIRTPQYTGLTKTYDPISAQIQVERIAQQVGDHIAVNQRLSELESQYYFQKQLAKLRDSLIVRKKRRRIAEKDPFEIFSVAHEPTQEEEDERKPVQGGGIFGSGDLHAGRG